MLYNEIDGYFNFNLKKGEKTMKEFKQIELKDINILSYLSPEEENFVIVSGDNKHHNAMVTNQISFGRMRDKDIATIYLGKDFYTRGYIEKKGRFSINLLPKSDASREILDKLAHLSGKDSDKFQETGLTLIPDKTPKIEEAEYVLTCRVIYRSHLEKDSFFKKYKKYAKEEYENGFDYAYVAEIKKVYKVIDAESSKAE
ncbi:hypothetical protein C5Q98_00690 [Fastidiosipila sanguinis]|uniref:Flavin reductase like domain-containing protein n=2 Tax=Fastidiosipila sanguinis TaxID=236753 RepID=A0A2S0KLB6_9FIRM|nr:hypothetical protein C5Q98_00690 [Fastidiosipila sanguinis]